MRLKERDDMKLLDYIYMKLQRRAFDERHKVTQLKWQKAQLEQKIEQAKRARKEGV